MIKGNKTILKAATLADRQRVYDWCFQSETTKSHSGPPDYPEKRLRLFKSFTKIIMRNIILMEPDQRRARALSS